MNTNQAYNIMKKLKADELQSPKAHLVDLIIDFARVEEDLLRCADQVEQRMHRVRENVEQGYTINKLGELQGKGDELDRLCGLRHAAAAAVRLFAYRLVKWNLATREEVNELLVDTVFVEDFFRTFFPETGADAS